MKKLFLLLPLLALIIIPLMALANYTDPTFPNPNPPNCPAGYDGCDPPIDVSIDTQTKTGSIISLNGIWAQNITANSYLNILMLAGGSNLNKVLTTDDNGRVILVDQTGGAGGGNSFGVIEVQDYYTP